MGQCSSYVSNAQRFLNRLLFVGMPILLAGCVGPQGIKTTRLKYNEAIRQTNEEELLLSLVRSRYLDSNIMLRVSNITSQMEATAGSSFLGGLDQALPTRLGGFSVGFADRPTVVLSPPGAKFYETIVEPIPERLPARAVLRLALRWLRSLAWQPSKRS